MVTAECSLNQQLCKHKLQDIICEQGKDYSDVREQARVPRHNGAIDEFMWE